MKKAVEAEGRVPLEAARLCRKKARGSSNNLVPQVLLVQLFPKCNRKSLRNFKQGKMMIISFL